MDDFKKQIINKNKGKILIFLSLLILFLVMIFIFSQQNGDESHRISSKIASKLKNVLSNSAYDYLKLKKKGNSITAYYSDNGLIWEKVQDTIEVEMNNTTYIGLVSTSRKKGKLCKAAFEDLKIYYNIFNIYKLKEEEQFRHWTSIDIGNPDVPGTTEFSGNKIVVEGSGVHEWNVLNGFHFTGMKINGDYTLSVKVVSIEDTEVWAKAGIMIRNSLEKESNFVNLALTPKGFVVFESKNEGKSNSKVGKEPKFNVNTLLRKLFHFIEFFILSILVNFILRYFNFNNRKRIVITLFISIAVAMLDEFHQIFVPGRNPLVTDIIIDLSGALLGITVFSAYLKHRNKVMQ